MIPQKTKSLLHKLAQATVAFLVLMQGMPAQEHNVLRSFFVHLNGIGQEPTNLDQKLEVVGHVPAMSQPEITDALPSILIALESSDVDIRKASGLALAVIGRRPDGPDLLKPILPKIVERLKDDPNPRMQAACLYLLDIARPPSTEVVPILLSYLTRHESAEENRPVAISMLLSNAPRSAEVTKAIVAYFALPMARKEKMEALTAIETSRVHTEELIHCVASVLRSEDERLVVAAAESVQVMGPEAVSLAQPELLEVLLRPDITKETREKVERVSTGRARFSR